MANANITRSNKMLTRNNKRVTGCNANYRRARLCSDLSLTDVWMPLADAILLTGLAFYVPWLGVCCYFDFTDPVYSTLGGTLYARADVTSYANCTACLPCFNPATPSPLPTTINFTLPTLVTFASCTTPAVGSPSLTTVVMTKITGVRWQSPTLTTGAKIAGWLTRPAIITGSGTFAYLTPEAPLGCAVWEFVILYQEATFPFSARYAVWRRRRISSAVTDLYGGYYFAGISNTSFPTDPTFCPGATATPFLFASP